MLLAAISQISTSNYFHWIYFLLHENWNFHTEILFRPLTTELSSLVLAEWNSSSAAIKYNNMALTLPTNNEPLPPERSSSFWRKQFKFFDSRRSFIASPSRFIYFVWEAIEFKMVFGVYMHAVEVVFSRIFSQFALALVCRICAQQRKRKKFDENSFLGKKWSERKTRALFSSLLFDDKNEILIPLQSRILRQ